MNTSCVRHGALSSPLAALGIVAMITVKQRWPAWAQVTSRSRSYVKCGNIELFSCQGSVLYASLQVMLSGMEGAARSRRSLPAALACATLISLAIACSPFGVLPATDAQKVVPFVTPPSPARLAYVTGTARSAPAVWAVRANEKRGVRLGPGIEPLLSPDGRRRGCRVLRRQHPR